MPYEARIQLDSISPRGHRVTTFVVTYPRFVHSEMMTHRVFSRNSASSRAIPIEKMIEQVQRDPVMPVWWGAAQKGMQATVELDGTRLVRARSQWLRAWRDAIFHARELADMGLHKQIVNRVLEPWAWITVIITATDYENFFRLRCHPDAQPEIRKIAEMMRDLYMASVPTILKMGEWHMPFMPDPAPLIAHSLLISAARCARVSYLGHDGTNAVEKDLALAKRLYESGHMSPFEHQATPSKADDYHEGNLVGWHQSRHCYGNVAITTQGKCAPGEDCDRCNGGD